MPCERHTPQQIIGKLREVEVAWRAERGCRRPVEGRRERADLVSLAPGVWRDEG